MTKPSTFIIRITLAFVFLLVAFYSKAQDAGKERLTWKVTRTKNLANHDEFDFECVFKTDGKRGVSWEQKKGLKVTQFTILATVGEWPDITTPGSITYQVLHDENKGTLVFERKSGANPVITLDFSAAGEHGIRQQFMVENVQPGS